MSGFANKKMIQCLCCLFLAGSLALPVHSQAKTQEPFASVPTLLRERLIQRLKMVVDHQRGKHWGALYPLLSVTVTHRESKEDFIKRNQRWYTDVPPEDLILNFHPKNTMVHRSSAEDGWWTVYGCAKVRNKGQIVELQATVDAYREQGDWYFSEVGIVTQVDEHPKPCGH